MEIVAPAKAAEASQRRVEEHELRNPFRRRCSRSHGDTEIGVLERECVVHAVARHRHDLAAPLPGPDDPQLVRRGDTGVDRDRRRPRRQRVVGQRVEVLPRRHAVGHPGDAQFAGDRQGRRGMVARDHERADSGRDAGRHRRAGLVARRIDHPHEPAEHEPVLEVVGRAIRTRRPGIRQPGHPQHPQRVGGQVRGPRRCMVRF